MPIIMPSPRTGKEPKIDDSVFIAPNAVIIGDVELEEGVNVWFGSVLRGDWGTIKIGKNTSIQENVTIHIEMGKTVKIGSDCIIGHHAMIHAPCEVGDGCIVGIGSNMLHNSKLGDGSILAAGAVLLNKEIPPRSLAIGIPASIKKEGIYKGKFEGAKTSGQYVKNGEAFKKYFKENPDSINL
ncbi:MAG: gamma carbonic anhydrase family protein [Candidatus Lokiarchaeota archaeon]|nr:gamma carbonic anhydrase family protein [Candidatus Lokiarchaeota archaeon]MBD3199622.1 gamma carbonic anhydrase family protein [Candidatus Lokiarchaeota archaeon]